ncbi:hypothetical protein QWY84_17480 [Aquisalimonas lutea]|uniref:hypothetical protein n=1 Tax=Aquisalimonas lutea TaxID=1327750 RepID=UPI0025B3326B|nr:hypothetical protein [Aquisalimonas lutea]MDN3519401.1 hypothetical protein [Aquisalimonas lutea]
MKRILAFYWPLFVLLAVAATFAGYSWYLEEPACSRVAGVNVALLGLAVFCFVLPAIVAVASAYGAWVGLLALRAGRFPPAGIPGLERKKIRYGSQAKALSVVALLSPVLAVVILWLGIASFDAIAGERSVGEMQERIESECR